MSSPMTPEDFVSEPTVDVREIKKQVLDGTLKIDGRRNNARPRKDGKGIKLPGRFYTQPLTPEQLRKEVEKARVVDLYLEHKTQGEIGKIVGITGSEVSKILRTLLKEWDKANFDKFDRFRAEELDRINHMEKIMWEKWYQSCQGKDETIHDETTGKVAAARIPGSPAPSYSREPNKFRIHKRSKENTGNMEYWKAIQWCVQQRKDILNMGGISKVNVSGNIELAEWQAGAKERLLERLIDIGNNRQRQQQRDAAFQLEAKNIHELEAHNRDISEQGDFIDAEYESSDNDLGAEKFARIEVTADGEMVRKKPLSVFEEKRMREIEQSILSQRSEIQQGLSDFEGDPAMRALKRRAESGSQFEEEQIAIESERERKG